MAAPSFQRAPLVEIGSSITSTQARGIARAFNDRLRLISDLPWRISWYWFNLFRQIRNSDGGFAFPPQGEWFEIYQHIDPDYTMIEWPTSPPGEPEGINIANPMGQFIFGREPDVFAEFARVQIPLRLPGNVLPSKPSEYWYLAKFQRGALDPATGAQYSPAFDAAISLFHVGWFHPLVPYHKSYGGWLPTPLVLADNCGDLESNGLNIPSYQIFFTGLRSDVPTAGFHGSVGSAGDMPTLTYAGTCPCGTLDHGAGHVLGILRAQLGYYVYVSRGGDDCQYDIDYLPARDWIEGPYSGDPYLAHDDGGQLSRVANFAHVDFRGSEEQRKSDDFAIEEVGFDNQAFFTRQYPLAPALGRYAGGDLMEAIYPTAKWDGYTDHPAGSLGTWGPTRFDHRTTDPFVAAGFLAVAKELIGSATIEILDGDEILGTLSLVADEAGDAEAILYLAEGRSTAQLRVRLATDARLRTTDGAIAVEVAEILPWKPYFWDSYLVTRLGGTIGGSVLQVGVDGRGVDFEEAPQLGQDLMEKGCLFNGRSDAPRDQADWINDNPIYDAARRLISDHLRIVHRRQFVGYGVEDGKSVLYVKRFAYGLQNSRVDYFASIAPSLDPAISGRLVPGETYVVHAPEAGSITYRGATYRHGDKILAVEGFLAFQWHGLDTDLFVYDGIRHQALKKGVTNEWVMVMESKPYHPSATSIWKPEAYTDYFTYVNRCLLYPAVMPYVVRRHVAFNHQVEISSDDFSLTKLPMSVQASIISPEGPSGMHFSGGTNRVSVNEDFCASCPVYPSPYEVESCTVHERSGDQVLKIVFKGRFRHHPDAPASVDPDAGSWSEATIDALRLEAYRTDDNACREYARHAVDAGYHGSWKNGDAANQSNLPFTPDNPFGSIYPSFHFVKLIPEPYEDGNDTVQSDDRRCLVDPFIQMETYLKAICEAFVDGRTSAAITCQTAQGGLYDYTFENLCFDAFGGRWIGAFDLVRRPDSPPGFGPLPNTDMYAAVFNRLASAVNQLTRIRLDIPIQVDVRNGAGEARVSADMGPSGVSCTATGSVIGWADNQTPPAASVTSWDIWDVMIGSGFGASQGGGLDGCPFELVTQRVDVQWRISANPAYAAAMPAWLDEAITDGAGGLLASIVTTTSHDRRVIADGFDDGDPCCRADHVPCPGHWLHAGQYMKWLRSETSSTACVVLQQGTVTAPAPPTGDFSIGRDPDMAEGVWCGNSSAGTVSVTLYDNTPFIQFALRD